ncbi:MAG TPA: ATP-binding protein [Natrialbaceae archaeon]|nr:ATP-binding protein [Natrialbaceae archaeon]
MTDSRISPETTLEGILRTLSAPVIVLNENGEFLEVLTNSRSGNLLYDDPSELVGEDLFDVFPEERAAEFQAVVDRTLETGQVQEYRYQLAVKSGVRHFLGHAAPLPGDDGSKVVCIVEDVTERVEIESERERKEDHLVRTETLAQTGGWEYVPSTETLRWTDGTRRIFDVPEDYVPTISEAFEFYHPADRKTLREAFDECLESGRPYSLDLRILTEAGRQRWVETRCERTREDGTTKLIGVMQDVTKRKTDEQRLMVLNRVLRHNLRNELNAVRGYADIVGDQLADESQEHFDGLVASADRLLSLADKLRRFKAVIEADDTTGPVSVESVLESLCDEYREAYPDATIRTDLLDVAVPGKEHALKVMFEELLENALEHTDGPNPDVTVTVSRPTDQRVAVSIADDGPGLPEIERQVIRDGEETALLHSEGMGLWIVNWFVTKLSGSIQVTTAEGDGTTVTITLPVANVRATGEEITSQHRN